MNKLVPFLIGLLILPLFLLFLAFYGLVPLHATAKPPSWEESIAQRALKASLARRVSGIRNPLTPSEDVLLNGMKLYRMNCAGCHGDSNAPSDWGTKNFYPRVPQFAQRKPDLTPAEMFVVLKHGIRYSGMGSWSGLIPESDMWKIVTFLSRIDALPPAVSSKWKPKVS